MIKVLQIIDGKSFGGIVKIMLEIEKNISKDIELDFITAASIIDRWKNLNISRNSFKGKIVYNYRLLKYLKNNKYDIVHINSGAFFYTFQVVIISKLAKARTIVVHSHNTPNISRFKKIFIKLLNPIYTKMINVKLACSKEAAKSLFTKTDDVIILKNGINIDQFRYNEKVREEYRKKLGIENKMVYGHVGRFSKQKNHEFLVDLFFEIQKVQDAVLLLIGTGELENTIKEKVRQLNLENKVIFLGFREDIGNLLNCMDFFLFPSLFEGLGIVLIEAQTSGLPVFVSKGIPDEAKINNDFYKIKSFDIKEWTSLILDVKYKDRYNSYKETIKAGYDIKETCKNLEHTYYNLFKMKKG